MTYPDTPAGVRRLLHDETDLHPEKLARTTLTPDPEVRGAWLVTLTDGRRLSRTWAHTRSRPRWQEGL